MTRSLLPVPILILAAALAGCAGPSAMSAGRCADADWRAVGLEDGSNGKALATLEQRIATCTEAGVEIDTAAYKTGRTEGLVEFCSQRSGYRFGRRNGEYEWVCDRTVEDRFVDAYKLGLHMYGLSDAFKEADRKLNRMENDMRRAQNRLNRLESQINNPNTEQRERMRLHNERQRLAQDIFKLQADRAQFTQEKASAERELKKYQERLPPYARDKDDAGSAKASDND